MLLSIGGNHVIHSMRNVDIYLVMFNNRIYGSGRRRRPSSGETKSTPLGIADTPIIPLTIALAAEVSFVARSVDTHTEHLQGTLAAGRHKGSSFVEVLQNCNIFNDGAWRDFTERDVREDRMLILEATPTSPDARPRQGHPPPGPPPGGRGIGENGITEGTCASMRSTPSRPHGRGCFWPAFPVGVLRSVERPTHDRLIQDDRERHRPDLDGVLNGGETDGRIVENSET